MEVYCVSLRVGGFPAVKLGGAVPSPAGLQNLACRFPGTRLLSSVVLVTHTSPNHQGSSEYVRGRLESPKLSIPSSHVAIRALGIYTVICAYSFHTTVPTSAYLRRYPERWLLRQSLQSVASGWHLLNQPD